VIRNGKEVAPSETPGKVSGFKLRRDDVVSVRTSGGGGWGDALERDPQKVLADVLDGYLTASSAKEMFGVVIKNGKVSQTQTTSLRKTMRKKQPRLVLKTFPEQETNGRRYCELSPSVMKQLGVSEGMALELETPNGPVLRVWARKSNTLSSDVIRAGTLAAEILRVRPGQRVAVRRLRATAQRPLARS